MRLYVATHDFGQGNVYSKSMLHTENSKIFFNAWNDALDCVPCRINL